MYQEYFGFQEPPFSIAPDPRYLYMSERHQEALAHLLYGIGGQGGFILLTGEVGTGKTTVCRCLLEKLPARTEVAFLFNPKLTATELLASICDELRIAYPSGTSSIKVFTDRINAYLLEAHAGGGKTVLIIDEAQNLSVDVLEQIRLLTNLETTQEKLLQIVMLGQPELLDVLKRPELRQLAQRVTARYHLDPLNESETSAYVRHRLGVAGNSKTLFPQPVIKDLFVLSGGVPRLINLICDRALLGAFVQDKEKVDRKTLRKAANEVKGGIPRRVPIRLSKAAVWGMGGLLLAGAALTVAGSWHDRSGNTNASIGHPLEKTGSSTKDLNLPGAVENEVNQFAPLLPPADLSRTQSEFLAYQNLFQLWGIEFDPLAQEPPCQAAAARGLKCFSGAGSLRDLQHLDRPAVLTFYDDRGKEFFGTLTRVAGQSTAVIALGSRVQPVTQEELLSRWRGEFLLFWRSPAEWKGFLEKGDTGPDVAWLAGSLSLVDGIETDPARAIVFDDRLSDRLKRFQLISGLVPDGIAGPRTLIQLNSHIYSDLPRLTQALAQENR